MSAAEVVPYGRRRVVRRLVVLLAAALSLVGVTAAVRPAPARAVTDFALEGQWAGFPWATLLFVGSNGYLPNACGPQNVFRNLRKVGTNHWTGEIAPGVIGGCPVVPTGWTTVSLTINDTGTQLFQDSAGWDTSYSRVGALPQRCPPLQTATRPFQNTFLGGGTVFSVQFTNLNYCFDWKNVWFRDNPQFRIYIGSAYSLALQGACNGVSRTDTGTRLPSIYVTCNAVFSNKNGTAVKPKADVDQDGSSLFTIPGYLNIGLNLGPAGFLGVPVAADQTRFYTLRLYANGCYNVSGVGNSTLTCP